MERQPEHWLYRFTAAEWLQAARGELGRARQALARGDRRKGLFEARRAAGMALNAVLRTHPQDRYGRSYMEHLAALALDDAATEEVRACAARLLEKAPTRDAQVVKLPGMAGEDDLAPARWAEVIVAHAAEAAGLGAS
jgi:hypothetical protein